MREISVNGVKRLVPQSIAELSPEELCWLIRHFIRGTDDLSLKIHFAARYFRLPINRINRLGKKVSKGKYIPQLLSDYENYLEVNSRIYLLAQLFDFLVNDRKLDRNPFPVIRFPWWRFHRALHGPTDGLKNLSIWEFAVAEQNALMITADNQSEYIDRFIAVLYRPASLLLSVRSLFCWQSDKRVVFNDQRFAKRIPAISRIPMEVKVAVLLFFNSVRNSFKEPGLFPHVYCFHEQSGANKDLSWADVIMEMSGEVPGNEDKTGKVNLYTFLYRLELNAIKLKEMERERKNSKL